MKGVFKSTPAVLDEIKQYPELRPYTLVGGTALAIRINHRLSEDIDLFAYQNFPGRKFKLPNLNAIMSKFCSSFTVKTICLYKEEATLSLDNVKVQLRAEHQFHGPKEHHIDRIGNIALPKEETLLGMKLVALVLRNTWRDVFDLTCLADRHKLSSFYDQYKEVMSTYYCRTERNRRNLFNEAIGKLTDLKKLEDLYQKDPMNKLITTKKITPDQVLQTFKGFSFQQ